MRGIDGVFSGFAVFWPDGISDASLALSVTWNVALVIMDRALSRERPRTQHPSTNRAGHGFEVEAVR